MMVLISSALQTQEGLVEPLITEKNGVRDPIKTQHDYYYKSIIFIKMHPHLAIIIKKTEENSASLISGANSTADQSQPRELL
jgi:hypothetical protein